MAETKADHILKFDDLVADHDIGYIEFEDKRYHYANVRRWSAFERKRLDWLWSQVSGFMNSEDEPTPEAGERADNALRECVRMVLPTLPEKVFEEAPGEALSDVMLDFFVRRARAVRATAEAMTRSLITSALSQRSKRSTAGTRKAG